MLQAPKDDLSKLLVHGIASGISVCEVTDALTSAGLMAAHDTIEGDVSSGKILLLFSNAAVANGAFASLAGKAGQDSVGRATKTVKLAGGAQVTHGLNDCPLAH